MNIENIKNIKKSVLNLKGSCWKDKKNLTLNCMIICYNIKFLRSINNT